MNRHAMQQRLAQERFDLLIIGGGITGAGVAREASLRGLKVGLAERGDFAAGTSSRSTKLIHGGLRYLANFDFKLVREAVQERMRLIDMAPHLVKVRPFVFPVNKADRVLAAAGPWADIIRRLDDPQAPSLLRCTKGVHLTLSQETLPLSHPVVMRGRDGRMMFAVPSGGFRYVGTTDTDHTGDPGAPSIDRSDVTYIRDAVRRAFPAYAVREEDVIGAWSGLRPLIRPAGDKKPSAVSRDYALYTSASGLVTAGGKLTAFRAMASHIVDDLFPPTRGGKEAFARSTAPLPGAVGKATTAAGIADLAGKTGAPEAYVSELAARFGTAFRQVAAELDAPDAPADPEGRWLHAQMRHAVHGEMAVRLADVLARRTTALLFSRGNGGAHLDGLAAAMGRLLGRSQARTAEEANAGRTLIDAMFAWRQYGQQDHHAGDANSLPESY